MGQVMRINTVTSENNISDHQNLSKPHPSPQLIYHEAIALYAVRSVRTTRPALWTGTGPRVNWRPEGPHRPSPDTTNGTAIGLPISWGG